MDITHANGQSKAVKRNYNNEFLLGDGAESATCGNLQFTTMWAK